MKKMMLVVLVLGLIFPLNGLASSYDDFKRDISAPYALYKKALALTSKVENKKKAIGVVKKYIDAWQQLAASYEQDAPQPFAWMTDFPTQINRPTAAGQEALVLLEAGEVHAAHSALEEVRYQLWEMRVKSGISSLNDKVNDFHEAMEIVLDGIKEHSDAADLKKFGNRYGSWLSIKWEEVGRAQDTGTDQEAFVKAVTEGRKAIADLREKMGTGDLAGAKQAGGAVKKAYKGVFFLNATS